jgi:hypothetical protein
MYFQLSCFVQVKDAYRTFRYLYVCMLRCSLPAFVFRYLIPKSLEQAQRGHQTTPAAVSIVKVRMMFLYNHQAVRLVPAITYLSHFFAVNSAL